MGKFKKASASAVDPKKVESFIGAANERSVPKVAKEVVDDERPPWEGLDRKEKPAHGINVRWNAYELALLRHYAEETGRSIQQTIRRLVIPKIEKEINSR